MKWWRTLESGAIYLVVAAALAAGLAASYGRELEAQRHPDGRWWLRRLLIIPMLAITATAAIDAFHLPTSLAAFATAMLSLGGYDGLRMVEASWRRRLDGAAASTSDLADTGGADDLRPGV